MDIFDKHLRVTMPDGSKYDVPVQIIALNRAIYYSDAFDGNVKKSLEEDTQPLFESNPYEIENWAAGNMDWDDVSQYAIRVEQDHDPDFQEGWVNGDKEIVEW